MRATVAIVILAICSIAGSDIISIKFCVLFENGSIFFVAFFKNITACVYSRYSGKQSVSQSFIINDDFTVRNNS